MQVNEFTKPQDVKVYFSNSVINQQREALKRLKVLEWIKEGNKE